MRHVRVSATWYWPGCTYFESRTGDKTWGVNGLAGARSRSEGEAKIRARFEQEADLARAAGDTFEWSLVIVDGQPTVSDVLAVGQ